MTPSEHYQEAERLLAEGVDVVGRISQIHEERKGRSLGKQDFELYVNAMDELGKKAMGIWAQAQVHATLATSPRFPGR